MCDYEVISHEPLRLRRSTPPHGSSGCHWLVTMCLCLIDCEMVCCCTAVSHLRPTKVIDWFGHVECSHLVHSNAFYFPHSWITSTGRRIVWLRKRQRPSENIFPFTPPPPLSFLQRKKKNIQIGQAMAPDYPGKWWIQSGNPHLLSLTEMDFWEKQKCLARATCPELKSHTLGVRLQWNEGYLDDIWAPFLITNPFWISSLIKKWWLG